MTTAELLTACKEGLNIQVNSTDFDNVITQKILAVKSFMKRSGVSDTAMEDDLAVGIIVMGVSDIWNSEVGEIKLSPAFNTLLAQLAFD